MLDRVLRAGFLTILLLLSASAVARADTIRGVTFDGRAVKLRTQDGALRSATLAWKSPCSPADPLIAGGVSTIRPRRRADGYFGRRVHSRRIGGGRVARIAVGIYEVVRHEHLWVGYVRVAVRIRRAGRTVRRCASAGRWSAFHFSAAMRLEGEPGEFITQGETLEWRTPVDTMSGGGHRRYFGMSSARGGTDQPYRVGIVPPEGQTLTSGTTFDVVGDEYEVPAGRGLLTAEAPGRAGCEDGDGQVTVEEAGFDRRDRVRSMKVSFLIRCGPAPAPALRGRITFRRAY